MAKMGKTGNRVVAIACAVLLVFGLFAFGVPPAAGASAADMTTAEIIADKNVKVSRLPNKDYNYIYILSNLWTEPIKFPMVTRWKLYGGEVADIDCLSIVLFDTIGNSLEYSFQNTSHVVSLGELNTEIERYNSAPVYDPSEVIVSDAYVRRKFPALGKSTIHGTRCKIDYTQGSKSLVGVYSNMIKPLGFKDKYNCYGFSTYTRDGTYGEKAEGLCREETMYLYLAYLVKVYSVTFNYRTEAGTETFTTITVREGENVPTESIPSVPNNPYGKFSGVWDNRFSPVTRDMIYNAVYDWNLYTVTYLDFDGKPSRVYTDKRYIDTLEKVQYGNVTRVEGNFKNTYRHDGWSTVDGSVVGELLSAIPITGDLMLYPVFTKISSTDLTTGDTVNTDPEKAGCGSGNFFTFKWISDIWESAGKVPVIGGFLRILWVIALVVLGLIAVPVIVLIIKAMIALVSLIINLFKKIFRRG